MEKEEERTIDRLFRFCQWCIDNSLARSIRDFEMQCGMATGYIRNSMLPRGKGTVGSEVLASAKRSFPMLNLDYIVLGEGNMITSVPIGGYVSRYRKLEEAMSDIAEILNGLKQPKVREQCVSNNDIPSENN